MAEQQHYVQDCMELLYQKNTLFGKLITHPTIGAVEAT